MNNFILQVFINIFAIIGTHFVTKKRDREKFTQELKQRHLKEIKEQIFQPILEILNNHWLPILERKRVNLQIEPMTKYEENIFNRIPISFKYSLSTYEEPVNIKSKNLSLYKDVIGNHYTQILKNYEAFKINADNYLNNCLSYAKEIKDQISQKIKLPDYNPYPIRDINKEEWINSCHLARFVLRKQMVPNDKDLGFRIEEIAAESSLKKIKDDSFTECALCSKPEKIKEVLEDLIIKRDKADELILLADKLRTECIEIKNEIEGLCLAKKLIGDCDFIQF